MNKEYYIILNKDIMSNFYETNNQANNIYQNGNNHRRITILDIIDYVENLHKNQQEQEIANVIREEKYQLLFYSKSRSLKNAPDNLKQLFLNLEDTIVRDGIITRNPEKMNMTFFMSLLYCLDPEYSCLPEDNREKQASDLKSSLAYTMKHSKLFEIFKYNELKWKKKMIIDDIACNHISKLVIKFIVDYFNINLFILDIENDNIITCYNDQEFDVYKNTIILSLFENVYEPVYDSSSDFKFWKYSKNYATLINNIFTHPGINDVIDFNIKNKVSKRFIPLEMEELKPYSVLNSPHQGKYHLCVQQESGLRVSKSNKDNSNNLINEENNNLINDKDNLSNDKNNNLGNERTDSTCNTTNNASNTSQNQYDEILCSETESNVISNIESDTETDFSPKSGIIIIKSEEDKEKLQDSKSYTIAELNKMKLDGLLKVAKSMNIVPTIKNGKYKTKHQLLIEINDRYKTNAPSKFC